MVPHAAIPLTLELWLQCLHSSNYHDSLIIFAINTIPADSDAEKSGFAPLCATMLVMFWHIGTMPI